MGLRESEGIRRILGRYEKCRRPGQREVAGKREVDRRKGRG